MNVCNRSVCAAMALGLALTSPGAAALAAEPPRQRTFDGHRYELAFHDEFDGSALDESRWRFRILGVSRSLGWMVLTDDAAWLDGAGHLVMPIYTKAKADANLPADAAEHFPGRWVPFGSMLRTRQEFTFGYHEVRVKMPIVAGVGMAVWLQSRGQTSRNPSPDPKAGAEIDVIEQTFFSRYGKPTDFKHATVHWGGYGDTHQWVSIGVAPPDRRPNAEAAQDAPLNLTGKPAPGQLIRERRTHSSDGLNFRDEQFHTVAVLWTPEAYQFFYDGERIGVVDVGVSESPGYMILSPRLYDFNRHVADSEKGLGPRDSTPARFVIDYYRVYRRPP